jgi:hypothetical protein
VKANFNTVLRDLDGTPFKEPTPQKEGEEAPDLTLAKAVELGLHTGYRADAKPDGEDKWRRFEILLAIREGGDGETELGQKQVDLIREAVGLSGFGAVVVGRVYQLLGGAP